MLKNALFGTRSEYQREKHVPVSKVSLRVPSKPQLSRLKSDAIKWKPRWSIQRRQSLRMLATYRKRRIRLLYFRVTTLTSRISTPRISNSCHPDKYIAVIARPEPSSERVRPMGGTCRPQTKGLRKATISKLLLLATLLPVRPITDAFFISKCSVLVERTVLSVLVPQCYYSFFVILVFSPTCSLFFVTGFVVHYCFNTL